MDPWDTTRLLILALLLPSGAPSLECTDHGAGEALQVGYQPMSGRVTAMDATDEYFCYACLDEATGNPVLHWCDVVVGGGPAPRGSCSFDGVGVSVLRADGTRVAALLSDGAWRVVDFADPGNPVVVASSGAGSRCRDLDLAGDLVVTAQDSLVVVTSLAAGGMQEVGRYARTRTCPDTCHVGVHSLDVAWPHCWVLVEEGFGTGSGRFDLVMLDLTEAAVRRLVRAGQNSTRTRPLHIEISTSLNIGSSGEISP